MCSTASAAVTNRRHLHRNTIIMYVYIISYDFKTCIVLVSLRPNHDTVSHTCAQRGYGIIYCHGPPVAVVVVVIKFLGSRENNVYVILSN